MTICGFCEIRLKLIINSTEYNSYYLKCIINVLFTECSLASFVSGTTIQKIPYVFLPLQGQIVYPSAEIKIAGMYFNSILGNIHIFYWIA